MGYLTTFTIYNDGCDLVKKHPKEFAEIIYKACSQTKPNSYPLGNHCNLIIAQGTRHADDYTIYVHAGNTVCEMNSYSEETKKIMMNHPKFFEKMLRLMERSVKELKKQYKDSIKPKEV